MTIDFDFLTTTMKVTLKICKAQAVTETESSKWRRRLGLLTCKWETYAYIRQLRDNVGFLQ